MRVLGVAPIKAGTVILFAARTTCEHCDGFTDGNGGRRRHRYDICSMIFAPARGQKIRADISQRARERYETAARRIGC